MGVKSKHFGKFAKFATLCLLFLVVGLFGHSKVVHAIALTNVGPNPNEFGTTKMYYTLSNTVDVNATSMVVPVYSPTKPLSNVTLQIYCMNRGPNNNQDGSASVVIGTVTVCNSLDHLTPTGSIIPATYSIPPSAFSTAISVGTGFPWPSGSSTTAYKALIRVALAKTGSGSYVSGYRSFKLVMPSGNLVGYSSSGNTSHFAVANQARCDAGIDSTGCGQYFNYDLEFAPACSETAAQPAVVELNDPDNGNRAIQPLPFFQPVIRDVTAGSNVAYHQTGSLTANKVTVDFSFSYVAGHKYIFELHRVYANNVIQFRLPFDSINYNIRCAGALSATSGAYNTSSTGSCTQASHGAAITTVSSSATDKYICFRHAVVNASTSTRNMSFGYGVRYTTQFADGTWNPRSAPLSARLPNPTIYGGACTYPNTSGYAPALSSVSSHYAASCLAANNNSTTLSPGGSTLGLQWTRVKIPGGTPLNTKFCEWMAFDPINYPITQRSGYSKAACITVVTPPPVPTCNDLTNDITDQEPGVAFTFHVTADSNQALYTTPLSMSITGGSVTSSGAPSGPDVNHVYTSATYTAAPGRYTVNYTINGVPVGGCAGSFTVGYRPYFNVIGGDVSVGAGFNDSSNNCTLDSTADLESWNNDSIDPRGGTNTYAGAGTTLGAFALGNILHFVTRSNATVGAAGSGLSAVGNLATLHPYDLSFANDSGGTTDDTGDYGGGFVNLPCGADYTSQVGTPAASGAISAPSDTATNSYSSSITLTGGAINSGQHVKMIVDGDVYITGDIKYNAYGSPDLAPSFAIYATGNIYVAGSVHELHGFYVAQGDSTITTGIFATCATGADVGSVHEITLNDDCDSQLNIFGAVAAQSIHFDRSYGSVNSAINNKPAESIIYSPELWVPSASGAACIVTAAASCPYAAISSLPPVL